MAIVLKSRKSGERFVFLGFAKSLFGAAILVCDKSGDFRCLPLRFLLGHVMTDLNVESVDGQAPAALIEALRQADVQAIRKSYSEQPGAPANTQGHERSDTASH